MRFLSSCSLSWVLDPISLLLKSHHTALLGSEEENKFSHMARTLLYSQSPLGDLYAPLLLVSITHDPQCGGYGCDCSMWEACCSGAPLTASLVQVHANELQVPIVWTPAAFFVGHVFATWAVSVGEAIAHQGHLWTRRRHTDLRLGLQTPMWTQMPVSIAAYLIPAAVKGRCGAGCDCRRPAWGWL